MYSGKEPERQKTEILYQGKKQKGSTECRRGGEIQKYSYYHHCYRVSSSLAAVDGMEKRPCLEWLEMESTEYSTRIPGLADGSLTSWTLFPGCIQRIRIILLLIIIYPVYSVWRLEKHCACEVLSEVIRVNAAIHADSHTHIHPPESRAMHRHPKLCMIMILVSRSLCGLY